MNPRVLSTTAPSHDEPAGPTGAAISTPTSLTPVMPFTRVVRHGDVEIVVVLGPDGRFLGISEVRVRRNFLTVQQKIAASGFHDVDHLYKE